MNFLKNLWSKAWFKTTVNAAMGGAIGAVAPAFNTGTLELNKTTAVTAAGGAIAAVIGLYQQHPTNPSVSPTTNTPK